MWRLLLVLMTHSLESFFNSFCILTFCQDFLSNLNPSLSVDDNKIIRWHPKFRLDDVPDVDEADMPEPPVVKTYSSAHDVLEKARDMIAPRVCRYMSCKVKIAEYWPRHCLCSY